MGITGGLFKLFEKTGGTFFRLLIGKDLARENKLALLRVIVGGILWGALGGTFAGIYLKRALAGFEWGSSMGLLMALMLLRLTISFAVHEEDANAASIAEQRRIAQERQQQDRQQKQ
jgi:hypothetical protein